MSALSRRTFLKSAAVSAALPAVLVRPAGAVHANDKINVGVIGVGKQGLGHFKGLLNTPTVEVIAASDVVKERLDDAIANADKKYGERIKSGSFAGTKGYADFRNLLGRVDCLQADVTRCGGISGLLDAVAFAHMHALPLSGHCAPSASVHALAAAPTLRHLEWFHDHVRIERLFFDGFLEPENGELRPDRSQPGHGLELKRADVEHWKPEAGPYDGVAAFLAFQ